MLLKSPPAPSPQITNSLEDIDKNSNEYNLNKNISTNIVNKNIKKKRGRKMNPKRVLDLRKQGLSVTDIAKKEDVVPSTVWKFLKKKENDNQEINEILKNYDNNKLAILKSFQISSIDLAQRATDSLREDVHSLSAWEKMNAARTGTMNYGIAYDKMRLEEGKASSITAHFEFLAAIKELVIVKKELKALDSNDNPSEIVDVHDAEVSP